MLPLGSKCPNQSAWCVMKTVSFYLTYFIEIESISVEVNSSIIMGWITESILQSRLMLAWSWFAFFFCSLMKWPLGMSKTTCFQNRLASGLPVRLVNLGLIHFCLKTNLFLSILACHPHWNSVLYISAFKWLIAINRIPNKVYIYTHTHIWCKKCIYYIFHHLWICLTLSSVFFLFTVTVFSKKAMNPVTEYSHHVMMLNRECIKSNYMTVAMLFFPKNPSCKWMNHCTGARTSRMR